MHAEPACEALFAEADSLYRMHWVDWGRLFEDVDEGRRAAFRRHLRIAGHARSCSGGASAERDQALLLQEAYGHVALGEYDAAFERFAVYFEAARHETEVKSLARAYWSRAILNMSLGRYAEAAGDFAEAAEASAGKKPAWRAEVHLSFGVALQRAKAFGDALVQLREAERLARLVEDAGLQKSLLARSFHFRADAAMERADHLGDARKAVEASDSLLALSLPLYEALPPSRDHAASLILWAENRMHAGEHGRALSLLSAAEKASRTLGDAGVQSLVHLKRGRLYAAMCRVGDAEAELRRAVGLTESTREGAEYRRRALLDLAVAEEVSGNGQRAERAYRKAIELVERDRRHYGTSLWSMSSFGFWQASAHRGLVRVLLRQGRAREAFEVLELSRARYLADLITLRRSPSELGPSEQARYHKIGAEISAVRSRRAGAPPEFMLARLSAREAALEAERQRLLHFAPSYLPAPLPLVQAALGEGGTLLSYFIDEGVPEFGVPGAPHVFVVSAGSVQAVPLPGARAGTIDSLLAASNLAPRGDAGGPRPGLAVSLGPLHALYKLLVQPALGHARSGRVVVVPDGPVAEIPFAALVEREVGNYAYADAPFLVRRYAFSHVPAAHVLLAQGGYGGGSGVLAVGVSQFSGVRAPEWSQPALANAAAPALPDLPGVLDELDAVTRAVDGVRLLAGRAATEGAFLAGLRRASVVHVASHAVVDASAPMRSALALHPSQGADGLVYVHELFGRGIEADLVVLSACNTARGKDGAGEGMLGLHYAFQALGARSTVASLWGVPDGEQADIVAGFYDALQEGHPKDEALRRAQLRYLEAAGGARQSPALWASPVLYGSAEPVDLGHSDSGGAVLFIVLASGTALALACRRRYKL